MNSNSMQSELVSFRSLSQADRLTWLTRLLHVISMAARDTYEIGTNGVANPVDLRRFNELIHHIASFQKSVAMPGVEGMPDTDLFDLLDRELSALDVRADEVLRRLP
ncbi:hypothetical protein [Variovorax paradoxus]|uniref:hypothetical protein n=1 Tax=Variovorax paradoxus TaxID=34073 RepID=UPI003D6503D1